MENNIKTTFFETCIHSPEPDKTCPHAKNTSDGDTLCGMVAGWWHDWSISLHKVCFMELLPRGKHTWRNQLRRSQKTGKTYQSNTINPGSKKINPDTMPDHMKKGYVHDTTDRLSKYKKSKKKKKLPF